MLAMQAWMCAIKVLTVQKKMWQGGCRPKRHDFYSVEGLGEPDQLMTLHWQPIISGGQGQPLDSGHYTVVDINRETGLSILALPLHSKGPVSPAFKKREIFQQNKLIYFNFN